MHLAIPIVMEILTRESERYLERILNPPAIQSTSFFLLILFPELVRKTLDLILVAIDVHV